MGTDESNIGIRSAVWKDVSDTEWDDYLWQLRHRVVDLNQLKKIVKLTPGEEEAVQKRDGRLWMAITPYWANLMDADDPGCPIRRQAIPTMDEFVSGPYDMLDPCAEDKDSPVPHVVHRYPDRVLLLATDICAMYCRHCTRRRMVGPDESIGPHRLEQAYEYIRSNKKIRDVLVSGGDPLMLSDEKLEEIISTIKKISHIELLRIGTRMPVTLPQRITPELVNMLKRYSPIWISVHFNHPKEITPQVKTACNLLSDNGIPLGSQTVLLRGINDRSSVMKKLMHELLTIRVRPYYIYQCDFAKGISHFRTPISVGINIIEKMRGHTSGYALPTYVVDAAGGGGKIPVSPNYLIFQSNGLYILRNYEGKVYFYQEEEPTGKPKFLVEEVLAASPTA